MSIEDPDPESQQEQRWRWARRQMGESVNDSDWTSYGTVNQSGYTIARRVAERSPLSERAESETMPMVGCDPHVIDAKPPAMPHC